MLIKPYIELQQLMGAKDTIRKSLRRREYPVG